MANCSQQKTSKLFKPNTNTFLTSKNSIHKRHFLSSPVKTTNIIVLKMSSVGFYLNCITITFSAGKSGMKYLSVLQEK